MHVFCWKLWHSVDWIIIYAIVFTFITDIEKSFLKSSRGTLYFHIYLNSIYTNHSLSNSLHISLKFYLLGFQIAAEYNVVSQLTKCKAYNTVAEFFWYLLACHPFKYHACPIPIYCSVWWLKLMSKEWLIQM